MTNFKHRSKLLWILIAAQVVFLVGITFTSYAVGWFGKEIRIETEPIDPRDLFYGDYVILNYDISRLDQSLWMEQEPIPKENSAVYVVMKPSSSDPDPVYQAVGVYRSKPNTTADEVVLRGKLDYNFSNQLHIRYGIERYYVPENTGKELEEHVGDMTVRIKSASWGQPVIQELEL